MKRIKITPGTKLADVLSEAAEAPIVLESNGALYRVARLSSIAEGEDPFAEYHPGAALAGMRAVAGSWSEIDLEVLKGQRMSWP